MKIEKTKFKKTEATRIRASYNESEYKKVYLTPFEAENFFDLGKDVQIEEVHYKNKVYVKFFVHIHINTLANNCQ